MCRKEKEEGWVRGVLGCGVILSALARSGINRPEIPSQRSPKVSQECVFISILWLVGISLREVWTSNSLHSLPFMLTDLLFYPGPQSSSSMVPKGPHFQRENSKDVSGMRHRNHVWVDLGSQLVPILSCLHSPPHLQFDFSGGVTLRRSSLGTRKEVQGDSQVDHRVQYTVLPTIM